MSKYLFAAMLFLLAACAQTAPAQPSQATLVYIRGDELVSRSWPQGAEKSTPLNLPPGCAVWSLQPAPRGGTLAIELSCASGPAVVVLEPNSGEIRPLIDEPGADSRILAWDAEGRFLYLKIDSLGNARIVRVDILSNKLKALPLPAATYDLSLLPSGEILATQTAGLGFGAETWLADEKARPLYRLLIEPQNIIAYPRAAPDGETLVYILFPDTQTAFPVGGLWLANAEGGNPQWMAEADAGHGFAPAWSPNGKQIAFVVRTGDASATNLALLDVAARQVALLTDFDETLVGAPVWSADGGQIFFDALANGKIEIWTYTLLTAEKKRLGEGCCPVWTER